MIQKRPAVYILASERNGTLYAGLTSDLAKRVCQHKAGEVDGFTKKYGVKLLVWYRYFETMAEAIAQEKKLKNWKRDWKIQLIEQENPYWQDLDV